MTVCAVVKADAYGHGAVECARALEQEGATWFGVTSTDEGVRLRESGIRGRILLMTGFWRGEEEAVIEHRLTPAVWQREEMQLLEHAAAKRRARRERAGTPGTVHSGPDSGLAVHVKIDTGMSRLGVPHRQAAEFAAFARELRNVRVESVMTHLASAEIVDAESNAQQLAKFGAAVDAFRRAGQAPEFVHAANSSAIVWLHSAEEQGGSLHSPDRPRRPVPHSLRSSVRLNMVRPGVSLYGYYLPFLSASGRPSEVRGLDVEPVLSWKTRIVGMRDVAAGTCVGYGGNWTAQQPARIAVLPVGYADGLRRELSSLGRVLVRGEVAPMVGNISMDLTLIDVTAIPAAQVGDEVIIFGSQGEHRLDAWEHATIAETIPYEILCGISGRVPRKYVE